MRGLSSRVSVFFPRGRKCYLTVQAEQQQHDEEENCPDCRKRHHGYSLGVGDEGQAGTCRGRGVGWWGGKQTEVGGATLESGQSCLVCIPVERSADEGDAEQMLLCVTQQSPL